MRNNTKKAVEWHLAVCHVTTLSYRSDELEKFLADGFEPYAISQPWKGRDGEYITHFLRKQDEVEI